MRTLSFLILAFCFNHSLNAQTDSLKLCPLTGVGFMLPDSIALGDTLRYSMSFTLPDGCANLVDMRIVETTGGLVHYLYRECPSYPCTDIVREGISSAIYIPQEIGKLYFLLGVGDQIWNSTFTVVYSRNE